MPAPIPLDFRELAVNEIILPTDWICKRNSLEFTPIRKASKYIGMPYKHVQTPLYPETVVIRKKELEKINVWCTNLSKIPGCYDTITALACHHPVFKNYSNSGNGLRNHYYIITGLNGCNYIGFTPDREVAERNILKEVSYYELIKILGGKVPKISPIIIRTEIDCVIKKLI